MRFYRNTFSFFLTLFFMSGFFQVKSQESENRPNIILILSDDMGYSDIGSFGGDIDTPNLDALAKNGLRLTQFYNGARCCPTRASLMTGCYPHQTGIGYMTNTPKNETAHDLNVPEYRGFLNRNTVTIAEVLKEAGYATFMTGKWHLGDVNESQWPLQRGFDKFYGILSGASNYFKPEYPRGITYMNDTISITDKNFYTTDAFTDYAIKFIEEEEHQKEEKPFFLYLAYNAPHWPLHAPQELIDKYQGRYMEGWGKLREDRYTKMKSMGLIDDDWELTDQDSRDWDALSQDKKEEMDLRRAIYSAMVDRMDQNIGRIIDHLKEQGTLENTLIIFLNDNGACAEFSELGNGPAKFLGTKDGPNVLSYGRAWANGSNTPYREYKHWVHEGGISTPFIVHWPAAIPKSNNGKLVTQYGFLPDLMATFLDVSKAQYPEVFQENKIKNHSGKSLVPLFKGTDQPIHTEPIFWEHEGNKAVRLGKYKLVSKWDKNKETNWELYDMEKDRTEVHDLSSKMPGKTKELASLYNSWAENIHVLPYHTVKTLRRKKKKNSDKKKP